jgi:hypothetical protein
MNLTSFAVAVGNRLTHGHERHGQRWHLHLPRDGEPAAEVRPLLVVLGLPTFGLALAISAVTTFGPVILLQLTHSTTAVGALVGVRAHSLSSSLLWPALCQTGCRPRR